jgi:hypothetical protein
VATREARRATQLGMRLIESADAEMTARLGPGALLGTAPDGDGEFLTQLDVWRSDSPLRALDGARWPSKSATEAQSRHRELVDTLGRLAARKAA